MLLSSISSLADFTCWITSLIDVEYVGKGCSPLQKGLSVGLGIFKCMVYKNPPPQAVPLLLKRRTVSFILIYLFFFIRKICNRLLIVELWIFFWMWVWSKNLQENLWIKRSSLDWFYYSLYPFGMGMWKSLL